MKVQADGFEFEFPGALAAYVFDEKDKSQPHFHGLSHAMKAVDLLVELPNDLLFIEVKDFHSPDDYNFKQAVNKDELAERREHFKHLRDVLVHKFRDTWLYHWADTSFAAAHKPIRYLCLLTLDNGLLPAVSKELNQQLPVGKSGPRWQRELAASCVVVNEKRWTANFPSWSLARVAVT